MANGEETQPINGMPTEVAADLAVQQLAAMRAELGQVKAELERVDSAGFHWDWEGFIRTLAVLGAVVVSLAAVLTGD